MSVEFGAVTSVIKAADVRMGPTVMIGAGNPILQQAEAVASAAWSKSEVPKAFHSALADVNLDPGLEPSVPNPAQQFFENNVRLLSIMTRFSPQPQLNAADAIVKPSGSPLPELKPIIEPLIVPKVEPRVAPASWMEYVPAPAIQPQTEARVATQSSQVVTVPTTQEQAVEEVVKEVELNEPERIEKHTEEERVDKAKFLHVIDRDGVIRRIVHIVGVFVGVFQVKKNFPEKGQPIKVKGSEAAPYLLPANKRDIRGGEINSKDPEEKLPDKTWDATVENLKQLEFTSEEQIRREVPKTVEDNHPVILATKGEVASEKNILRSHQHIRGRSHAHLEFEKRKQLKRKQVVRVSRSHQSIQVAVEEERKEVVTEGTIQDHPELATALGVGKSLGLTD